MSYNTRVKAFRLAQQQMLQSISERLPEIFCKSCWMSDTCRKYGKPSCCTHSRIIDAIRIELTKMPKTTEAELKILLDDYEQ